MGWRNGWLGFVRCLAVLLVCVLGEGGCDMTQDELWR